MIFFQLQTHFAWSHHIWWWMFSSISIHSIRIPMTLVSQFKHTHCFPFCTFFAVISFETILQMVQGKVLFLTFSGISLLLWFDLLLYVIHSNYFMSPKKQVWHLYINSVLTKFKCHSKGSVAWWRLWDTVATSQKLQKSKFQG